MIMIMEEMQFEEDELAGGTSQEDQVLSMFTKKPNRGPAVKSGAPMVI